MVHGALASGGYPLIALLMAMKAPSSRCRANSSFPRSPPRAHGQIPLSLTGIVIAAPSVPGGSHVMYWASRLAGRPLVMRYGDTFSSSRRRLRAPNAGRRTTARWHFHFTPAAGGAASHRHSRGHRADGLREVFDLHTARLGHLVRGAGLPWASKWARTKS